MAKKDFFCFKVEKKLIFLLKYFLNLLNFLFFFKNIKNYIVSLVSATRKKEEIRLGASPRASIALMKASCAWAFIEGRDYVIPEDVIKLAYWVLGHRILLHPKALVAEKTAVSLITELVHKIPVS